MTSALVAATIAALSFTSHTDTTVTVAQGTRLELENFGGDVAVETWAKNSVRVEAEHGSRTDIVVKRDGTSLRLDAESRHGGPAEVDYHLTIPTWMAIHVSGIYADVSVKGSRGEVRVETVQGSVECTGGRGFVSLSSVDGDVSLSDATGHIELNAVNDGVTVKNVEGELQVQGVNGDLDLSDVRCTMVDASTVNGGILFRGALRSDGRYSLTTHSGDIAVAVPDKSNLTVSVATFSGDFDSSFPIKLTETKKGRRFKFTLGNGSGQLELESFEGTIRLARPGEKLDGEDADAGDKQKDKNKDKNKDKGEEDDDGDH